MKKREEQKVEVVKKDGKNKIIILCLFIFVIYFIYTFFEQQTQINKYNSQIEVYNNEIKSKKEQIEYYKNQIDSTDSDEYIEQVARDSLGYVKPYEKVFVDTNK